MRAPIWRCSTSAAARWRPAWPLSFLIAILYNYTTRPIYQATAQILIDRDTPNLLPGKELVDMVQGGADYYQTQYQLLRGRMLAEKVVEALDLQKSPEFQTGPLHDSVGALRAALPGQAARRRRRHRRHVAFARGRCISLARDRGAGHRKPARQPSLHGLRP